MRTDRKSISQGTLTNNHLTFKFVSIGGTHSALDILKRNYDFADCVACTEAGTTHSHINKDEIYDSNKRGRVALHFLSVHIPKIAAALLNVLSLKDGVFKESVHL